MSKFRIIHEFVDYNNEVMFATDTTNIWNYEDEDVAFQEAAGDVKTILGNDLLVFICEVDD